jgi:hypothetical protein
VIRYEGWHPGTFGDRSYTKTSFIKNILIWPIQPTEAETAGARELAGAIIGAAVQLSTAGKACKLPPFANDAITGEEVTFLNDIATRLRDKTTQWSNPAPQTLVDVILQGHRC